MKYKIDGDKITFTREELEKVVAVCRCKAGSMATLELQYYYAGKADAYVDLIKRIDNEAEV
jgi:hypothetical protein